MALILLLFVGLVKAEPFPLTLVTGDEYPPFTDLDLHQGGMATSLVLSAFEKSGYFVREIEWLSWKRGYLLAQSAQYHGTFPYGWNEERAEAFYYSDSFFPVLSYVWTSQEQKHRFINMEDLEGLVFCNPRGYGNFGVALELINRNLLRRETPNKMKQCFTMLMLKRVDFVISIHSDAMIGLLESGVSLDEVHQTELIIADIPHHFIVSKQLPMAQQVIEAFNQGLKILRDNGDYDALKKEFNWVE
ncbi:MAG: ABC transporter substrate-binding protein [Saccharospirillaceae bacterium]|nr:ABC transporter substrate-binding protein [Pseudomonadales bacterium]NRB79950.1 ABC transporter substrate-binding protein [Saccharospirillaceae bacterium]